MNRLALTLRALSISAIVLASLSLPSALAEDAESERASPTSAGEASAEPPAGMVLVPGGKFTMGSTRKQVEAALALCESEKGEGTCKEGWFSDESPQKEVDVDAFYIDVFEVTVDAYKACVDAGACAKPDLVLCRGGDSYENWEQSGRGSHPINCVTWHQARSYCEWADKRLPTEEEWEKAARGTDGRIYPWGDSHPSRAGRVGNFADATAKKTFPEWPAIEDYDDGHAGTSPVGSYAAGVSVYGAYDMVGNVWEWTSTEASGGSRRVRRGASCGFLAAYVRAAYRSDGPPSSVGADEGFRCARSAP